MMEGGSVSHGNGEELASRLWRQVNEGMDKDRLLGDVEKRRRELAKKLGRELERNGWRIFVSGQAHAILTSKAPARRNAEVMLVRTVSGWRDEVAALLPDRLADFEEIVNVGLANPAPIPASREG